jgi:hypothetical protein
MIMAPGNAALAFASPAAFVRAYSLVEPAFAPRADIWMKTWALAALAARPEASAPETWMALKLWALWLARMPVKLITA